MPNANLREAHEHHQPPIMPAEFLPVMQSLLATLADIDFAHEHEVEKVNSSGKDDTFKAKLITKLDQLHQERRHPYEHELLRLASRMQSLVG
jgi:hypothetical protein